MPQLHNETPSAQNKRLKAELANERALCGELVTTARDVLGMIGNVDHSAGGGANTARIYGQMLNDIRDLLSRALKQANGKGL